MEIEELFDTLLSKPAEPPNSIDLSFIDQIDLKNLFEFLLSFFTEISKTFFGDDNQVVHLENLNDNDFKKINAYIESIGFTTQLKTYNIIKSNWLGAPELQNLPGICPAPRGHDPQFKPHKPCARFVDYILGSYSLKQGCRSLSHCSRTALRNYMVVI